MTDVTKVINGVNAVVIWDRDFQNGALVEEELAFMAQDDAGNVWSLGEYPEETGNGRVSAPSVWLAGNQQAIAGLLMRADPQPNTSSYLQGKAPAMFLDQASVTAVDQQVCIIPGIGVGQVVGRCGVEQETLALMRDPRPRCRRDDGRNHPHPATGPARLHPGQSRLHRLTPGGGPPPGPGHGCTVRERLCVNPSPRRVHAKRLAGS